jgi:predicted DNA-binding transcriptional regulator AlpA
VVTVTTGVGHHQRDAMSRAELLSLPAVVDVTTAARALGLGRSTAYDLARRGEFPCRILHIGSSYRVPTAELLRVLGIDPAELDHRPPHQAAPVALDKKCPLTEAPGAAQRAGHPAPAHEGRTRR